MRALSILLASLVFVAWLEPPRAFDEQVRTRPPAVAGLPSPQLLEGLIIMWSGPLDTIPLGWDLCDGTNGTPDLSDRFLLGVLPGEEPGAIGGAHDRVLAEANLPPHAHDFDIAGGGEHGHAASDQACKVKGYNVLPLPPDTKSQGDDAPSTPWRTTETSTAHRHEGWSLATGSSAAFDNRPDWYRLAFLRRNGEAPSRTLPMGAILLWRDPLASIPRGWSLCDGTKGTPDLTERFVLGVFPDQDPGETGGSSTLALTEAQLAEHDHAYATDPGGEHEHSFQDYYGPTQGKQEGGLLVAPIVTSTMTELRRSDPEKDHEHGGLADAVGAGQAFDNRPAHVELAYIMQTVPIRSLPDRIIAIWTGTLDGIPKGWRPCDGSSLTPDLRDLFVQGAPVGRDPGNLDGAHELALSSDQLPAHGHPLVLGSGSATPHEHVYPDVHGLPGLVNTVTDLLGIDARRYGKADDYGAFWLTGGEHGHTGTTGPAGAASPFDNRPAHYRVAFLIKD
jgi:microcystin-dependent protein